MILEYLSHSLPEEIIRTYQVAQGEFPANPKECDAWIITGSPASAYDSAAWIDRLAEFIRSTHLEKQKLVGICFGHQMVAHALGGKVEKSPKGWGVGVRHFQMTDRRPWMMPPLKDVSLLFSHQDQVTKLPEGARILAEDDFCSIQMYSLGSHIFCLQGHPEFTPEFARARLDSRIERIGKAVCDQAIKTLKTPTQADTVGVWIKNFLKN